MQPALLLAHFLRMHFNNKNLKMIYRFVSPCISMEFPEDKPCPIIHILGFNEAVKHVITFRTCVNPINFN